MNLPELRYQKISKHFTARQAYLLSKLGIETVADLLSYFPFRYEDRTQVLSIADALLLQEMCVVKAKVIRHEPFYWGKGRSVKIIIQDNSATAELVCFQRKGLVQNMPVGAEFYILAKFELKFNKIQSSNFEFEPLHKFGEIDSMIGRIVPIYRLTEGLKSKELQKMIYKGFYLFHEQISDPIPEVLLQHRGLMNKKEALKVLHYPKDLHSIEKARQRGAYEEFLVSRISLEERRYKETLLDKPHCYESKNIIDKMLSVLPFDLTNAQKRVIDEIWLDLQKSTPMHRLVQGDVGSGKTTVALGALLIASSNNIQSALLAPTEVLAFQHYKKIKIVSEQLDISIALLTGSTPRKEREVILEGLKNGTILMVIGTHALFQDEVIYQKLGLVIIDEQHKFGAEQRTAMLLKGSNPDLLTMTATPIPRTMTLALYGDMGVSMIDELPSGRQEIITKKIKQKEYSELLEFLRKEITLGRQVFVVCPLIDESEKLSHIQSAESKAELLAQELPEFSVALVHGRMTQEEKDIIMKDFFENKSHILVATTVIEVGIDIPNATVMVIENAERFGLAQLHQLRGRVGRGIYKSYCFAVTQVSDDDRRLDVFCRTTDGFIIAEEDLKIRGPGEILGTRQTGLPIFKLANFAIDQKILNTAVKDAQLIIEKDKTLEKHPLLKKYLIDSDVFHIG